MARREGYGCWASPLSADLVTAAQVGLAQPMLDREVAYWLETRPEEGGRTVLVRRPLAGAAADLTPPPFNVRTRVHEYGGGACAVRDGIVVAVNFADNWSVELWSGLAKFEHEVSIDGLGTVASVEHRPTTLGVNYHFNTEGTFRPYVGIGYGWVSVSGEQSQGALAGLGISASNADGITYGAGADFYINDNFFIRADVRKKEVVPAEQRSAYFPLNYGATLAQAEQLRSGDSTVLGPSDFVWRPEVTAMTLAQEKQYWSHP